MEIKKYAAIDVGSNAVRMLIANVIKTDSDLLFRKNALVRVPVRLGQDAFTSGEISDINIEKLVKSMASFKLLMEVHQVKDYLAYATSALRDAKNKKAILESVANKGGIKIEIIDGRKEAAIISNLNVFDIIDKRKNFLSVDVGGGSTELSILENGQRIVSKSFKIGTVRLLNNIVSKEVWEEFESWIKKYTSEFEKVYLLGTGGNINKLFKMAKLKEGDPISYLTLNNVYNKLAAMSYEKRIIDLGLNPDRSDVILPASEIYLKAIKWSGAKGVYVPRMGLSDGMIREMIKRD